MRFRAAWRRNARAQFIQIHMPDRLAGISFYPQRNARSERLRGDTNVTEIILTPNSTPPHRTDPNPHHRPPYRPSHH